VKVLSKRAAGFAAAFTVALSPLAAPQAQPLDMASLGKPPVNSWPTFNGDYTGQRYTTLTQIDESNVGRLKPAWTAGFADVGAQRGAPTPVIKATPLMVNGVMYVTLPDHVYALNAHTGKRLWSYAWQDRGGHLVGNRGVGMYKNMLYFMGPDDWVICLDAATGKERWRKQIADARAQYFTTSAPVVVKNHVLVGVGGDALDIRGFLLALDPLTGKEQWKFYTTPGKGEPGIETWPSVAAAMQGGGGTWMPGTYDPETNMIYWGTGNANAVYAGQGRLGNDLYTASIIAVDVDSGKLKWHFQSMPHDTHDYDNTNMPVLFDAVVDGKPRKLLSMGSRSGWFQTLDRVTGKYLVSQPFLPDLKWVLGRNDETGEPISDRAKDPQVAGSIGNANPTNWYNPSYSPKTGLFYLNAASGHSIYYLLDTSAAPSGYGGSGQGLEESKRILMAIDPLTGRHVWEHEYPNARGVGTTVGPGLMSTATNLLFTGDDQHNIIAFRANDGKILWHFGAAANQSNAPISYMLDGKQWIVMAAGDTLYAFTN
jgi:alcohol dehydrogenase (cytochrome c)